jgi:phage terminase large subunit-like protein
VPDSEVIDFQHESLATLLVRNGEWEDFVADLSLAEQEQLFYEWAFWGRPDQQPPPGPWNIWYLRAGRGFGKTRTGGETTRDRVSRGLARRVGIVAPTAGDARDVMIEGESGLLSCFPPWERPKYEPSKRRITFHTGAIGIVYSAEEPDRLRGPQHDWVWGDEPASWKYGQETLDNIRFGLRLGRAPAMMLTGPPKPHKWLRDLSDENGVAVTTGALYANMANLAEPFVDVILGRFEGTRLGRQEIHAEVLDDVEGALWTMAQLHANRIEEFSLGSAWLDLSTWLSERDRPVPLDQRRMWRTAVAVDPPGETAECGIAVGCAPTGARAGSDHAVILADESIAGRPEEWGRAVVSAYRYWNAQAVYVESNQGGDMVRSTIHAVDPTVPVKKITAQESKQSRAEPVAALYERGWVHHVGFLPQLEDQLTTWVPDVSRSPDRLDALVHLVRELLPSKPSHKARARSVASQRIPR